MRTLTTLAALAATAALGAGTAAAAPAPAPNRTATAPSAPAALTPQQNQAVAALTDALRRDLGLTPEQFLAQATVGERLSRAQTTWSTRFPEALGGVWLTDGGQGVVGVVPGPKAAALAGAAKDAGFTVKDVANTPDQLAQKQRAVLDKLATLPADQRALVIGVRTDPARDAVVVTTRGGTEAQLGLITAALRGLAVMDTAESPTAAGDTAPFGSQGGRKNPAGTPTTDGLRPAADPGTPATGATATGATTGQNGTASQPAGGSLGSMSGLGGLLDSGLVPDGPARTILGLLAGAGTATGSVTDGMNTQVPDPQRPVAPEQRKVSQPVPATGPVVGGTAYDVAVPDGILECSTGFNGELDGKPVVITAAHCASGKDGGRATFTDGTAFGTFTRVKSADVDSALIAVDAAHSSRFTAGQVGAAGGTPQQVTGTTAPVLGQKACKSGARTGYSCGTISQVGATIDVAGKRSIKGGFTVDLCALPGDSGGAVFSGDKALGISSASNVADAPDCTKAAADARAAGYTPRLSVVPMATVLAAQPGLRLKTS